MAKSTVYSGDLLKLAFNATPITGIADNAATAPATELFVALHTADPGAAGNQSTTEIAYTGYLRAPVARDASGFAVVNNSVSPVNTISFPAGTGGTGVAAFWSIGTAATGTGKLLYSGPIAPTITCGQGITPQLTTASTVTES